MEFQKTILHCQPSIYILAAAEIKSCGIECSSSKGMPQFHSKSSHFGPFFLMCHGHLIQHFSSQSHQTSLKDFPGALNFEIWPSSC